MLRLRRTIGAALLLAGLVGGCGSDKDPSAATATTTTSSTTTTTPSSDSSSSSAGGAGTTSTTLTDDPDGIVTTEDVAVFVVNSWVTGDRESADRHAAEGALDDLFASTPPPAEQVEFIHCDSADLEQHDCFFNAAGATVVVTVDDLQVIATTVDDE